MKKQYTIVSRRSNFSLFRSPVWETFVRDKVTKKNPRGIYCGALMTKNLFITNDYQEAKAIKLWLEDAHLFCQHKIVDARKIKQIVSTTKKAYPSWERL